MEEEYNTDGSACTPTTEAGPPEESTETVCNNHSFEEVVSEEDTLHKDSEQELCNNDSNARVLTSATEYHDGSLCTII